MNPAAETYSITVWLFDWIAAGIFGTCGIHNNGGRLPASHVRAAAQIESANIPWSA